MQDKTDVPYTNTKFHRFSKHFRQYIQLFSKKIDIVIEYSFRHVVYIWSKRPK